MLKTRLLASSTYGLKILNQETKVQELFDQWSNLYETYVALVEDLINDGFSRHQRDEDLSYGRRRTTEAFSIRPAYLPYHLFGQLASSKSGMEALIKHPEVHEMLATLQTANDKHWLKIKVLRESNTVWKFKTFSVGDQILREINFQQNVKTATFNCF